MRSFIKGNDSNKQSNAQTNAQTVNVSPSHSSPFGSSMQQQSSAPNSRTAPPQSQQAPQAASQQQSQAPAPQQAAPSQVEARAAAPAAIAVIGPKIRVKGELVGEEDLVIQGQVEGSIDLNSHSLVIGEQGKVTADIIAKKITVHGTVEGDLFGQERISIMASSNVKGNLVADRVTLEDGAKFRGSIDMDGASKKEKLQKVGLGSAPAAQAPKAPAGQSSNNQSSKNQSSNKKKAEESGAATVS